MWARALSGQPYTCPDVMLKRLDDGVSDHPEPAAQIIPNGDAELVTSLGQTEKRITTITADLAACPGADLAPRDVTADVVLRSVGMERNFRPIQHRQQFSLVRMQPCQQAIQRGEAGAAEEDAVEPGTQRTSLTLAGFLPVNLEIGVELPDQTTLSAAV